MAAITPLVLCVMDGVGLRQNPIGNAWAAANTPNLDRLMQSCPHSAVRTDGPFAGLPEGQMGNSEVGHTTMGCGRVELQSLEKLNQDIGSHKIAQRPVWQQLVDACKKARAVHLVGLVSTGGVHSHTSHAAGLAELLSPFAQHIFVHAITDGRDTAPQSAMAELAGLDNTVGALPNAYIADVCGRFYAMDRDQRWERSARADALYRQGQGQPVADWRNAVEAAYAAGQTDEFIEPAVISLPEPLDARIQDGDVVLCFNFRADRMRQFVRSLIDDEFTGFERGPKPQVKVFTMTEYDATFNNGVTVLYPPEQPQNSLGEVVSSASLNQLRIAESEKYAHVTFFFNGGREEPFGGEERIVIPSPKVKTYDLQPEMSLKRVMQALEHHMRTHKPELVVLNMANGDQVGHSGVFEAAVTAMEAVDKAVGQLESWCRELGYDLLLTADHGNVEEMLDAEGNILTSHTTNPVPLIYVGAKTLRLRDGGLADIAPTCLKLMGLPQPQEMTGQCLAQF